MPNRPPEGLMFPPEDPALQGSMGNLFWPRPNSPSCKSRNINGQPYCHLSSIEGAPHKEKHLSCSPYTLLRPLSTMQKQQHSVLFLGNAACLRLVPKPSQSLASHRRVRGAYWKINGVNAKQVTGRCGKEGLLLIKQR